MSINELPLHRGASVLVTVDGQEALGILNFSAAGVPSVTTLCFVSSGGECPLIQHALSEVEIAEITAESRNRLLSSLKLSSAADKTVPSKHWHR